MLTIRYFSAILLLSLLVGCDGSYAPIGYWPMPIQQQDNYPQSINFYDQWGYQGTGQFGSSGNMYFYPSYNYPNYGNRGYSSNRSYDIYKPAPRAYPTLKDYPALKALQDY